MNIIGWLSPILHPLHCAKICSHGSGIRPLRSIKLQLWGVTWRDEAFGPRRWRSSGFLWWRTSEKSLSELNIDEDAKNAILGGPGVELGVDAHLQGASTAPQNLRGNHLKHANMKAMKHISFEFHKWHSTSIPNISKMLYISPHNLSCP